MKRLLLLVLPLIASCDGDFQVYVPDRSPTGGDGDNRFGVTSTLRSACRRGDLYLNDQAISAGLVEAEAARQQGYTKYQAANVMQINCNYDCQTLCFFLYGDCPSSATGECHTLCVDCANAIVDQIYD